MDASGIFLLPTEASHEALGVDQLFYGIVAASVLVASLVAGLIAWFSWRFRAGNPVDRKPLPKFLEEEIEITWTVGTLFAFAAMFWWASTLDLIHIRPPPHTLNIRVIAKQWMWKIEQPNGVREIDTLHLPLNTPVQLLMTSQDVIHSFYVPAFRAKQDVLPDRVTRLWFTPDKIGTYALKCAEYCGTYHSEMDGQVVVMSRADYAKWAERRHNPSLMQYGSRIYVQQGCSSCHGEHDSARGPTLINQYARRIKLRDGKSLVVNGAFLRQSIVSPQAQPLRGTWTTQMPQFGRLSDKDLAALVSYIKTLSRVQEKSP